jgi:neutral ceramidase
MNLGSSKKISGLFGAATADITPTESILLAGYMRDQPTSEVRNPIHAKAAYFRSEEGDEAVIVNADVVGFSRSLIQRIADAVTARHGIAREHLILSATHNHSGPVVTGVLPLFHPFTEETEAAMDRYTERLFEAIGDCIDEAKSKAEPCRLDFYTGVVGFAVNRRRASAHLRHLPTVVDQDVPVLVATNADDTIRGILFGYACHTTVMFDNCIDGDYSGYAQAALERECPGSTAIFLAGCGSDSNPLPRRKVSLSQTYGNLLATAVRDAMASEGTRLATSRIRGYFQEIDLPLEPPPSEEALVADLDEKTLRARVIAEQFRPMPPEFSLQETEDLILRSMDSVRRKIQYQLDRHRTGTLATKVPFAIQILQLGGALNLVALAGEPVADYSLRLKEQHGFLTTWPLGYCHDLMAYIPSLRVLREGGYEGKTAMLEYGLPSAFCENVEALILSEVATQMGRLRAESHHREPVVSDLLVSV